MGCRVDVVLAGRKTTLSSLCISIRALGWPRALSVNSNVFKEVLFFWALGLNHGLKILSKPCCKQMCCHLGSVASFIEPRQNEFSRIPRSPVISEMENETGFNFKSTAVWAPNMTVSLSFEALKPGIYFFLSSYECPRWHLLPIEGHFVDIENLFSHFVNYLS